MVGWEEQVCAVKRKRNVNLEGQMSNIKIQNLTKRYGDMLALNNVSLTIESGEFLILLGPSGCGKTTLLRCIAGLETPDEGQIMIGDKVIFSSEKNIFIPPGDRNLGMVFQSYALWPHMTVRDNMKFGLDVMKMPVQQADKRLEKVLTDLGMSELRDRYPSELSGGQQQRVALGRLLAAEPAVFLMDEPLSNLDARLRMDMRVELKKFQASTGSTTVYVTHDQTEAMTMATRVVVMKNGNIQQVSPPTRLYKNPQNTFVADFIGMPRINLLSAKRSKHARSVFTNGDIELDIGWCPDPNEIIIGARPEDLTICKAAKHKSSDFTVSSVLPNGPEVIVQLIGGSTSLLARVNHDVNLQQGELMKISFDKKALNIYDAKTRQLINRPES